MKILVTGANGQLGSELRLASATHPHDQFTFVDVEEMDLSTDQQIENYFQDKYFDFVVNCAAYTAVDKAEQEQRLSYRVNADAVKTIATICKQQGMRLIHISTDYVFDGSGNQPVQEGALPNPLSVYGTSKLEGERHVRELLKNAYIIRTAWVYSTFGKNFVKTISKLAAERPYLNVVSDQIGSPTYASDLAAAILVIIHKVGRGEVDKPGIYHYSNEGVISWYDFAWFIVNYYKLPCKINAISSIEYPTPAVRPKFSVLDKSEIKRVFAIEVPHWYESLARCLDKL